MKARTSISRLRKVRNLIRRAEGFSLTELLATMLILVLVGTVVAVGIPSAQRAYENVMNASNADVYLSTTTGRLRELLGEADPDPDKVSKGSGGTGPLITFISKKTGRQVSILRTSNGEPTGTVGIYVQEAQLDPVGEAQLDPVDDDETQEAQLDPVGEAQLDPVDDDGVTYETEPALLVPAAVGAGAGGVRFVAQVESITYENGLFKVHRITVKDANRLEEDAAYATLDELVVRPIAAS